MTHPTFALYFSLALAALAPTTMFAQGSTADNAPTTERPNIRTFLDPGSAEDKGYWQGVAARSCAIAKRPDGYDLKWTVSAKEEKAMRNQSKDLTLEEAQQTAEGCYTTASNRDRKIDWKAQFASLGSVSTKTAVVADTVADGVISKSNSAARGLANGAKALGIWRR